MTFSSKNSFSSISSINSGSTPSLRLLYTIEEWHQFWPERGNISPQALLIAYNTHYTHRIPLTIVVVVVVVMKVEVKLS